MVVVVVVVLRASGEDILIMQQLLNSETEVRNAKTDAVLRSAAGNEQGDFCRMVIQTNTGGKKRPDKR